MHRVRERWRKLGVSRCRIAALVIVIGGHLGLWLLVMRPAAVWRGSVQDGGRTGSVLELRFISRTRPIRLDASITSIHRPATHAASGGRGSPERHRVSQAPPSVSVLRPSENQGAPGRIVVRIPAPQGINGTRDDDGFAARLRAAWHSDAVRGVPGSDTTYAPGIHLIDPMDQGIGAVMRTTQRAFGITSRHCIDVDVWKHLTPAQLSARHISPDDVVGAEAKYHCDAPLGLHL